VVKNRSDLSLEFIGHKGSGMRVQVPKKTGAVRRKERVRAIGVHHKKRFGVKAKAGVDEARVRTLGGGELQKTCLPEKKAGAFTARTQCRKKMEEEREALRRGMHGDRNSRGKNRTLN